MQVVQRQGSVSQTSKKVSSLEHSQDKAIIKDCCQIPLRDTRVYGKLGIITERKCIPAFKSKMRDLTVNFQGPKTVIHR
jgi:hypothetical protein